MIPILCVGESAEERDAGTTEKRLATQLETAIAGLQPGQLDSLVVAYEPIWAIGSGRAATPGDFLREPDIDGLLVGGASLQAASLAEVIRAVGGCYRSPAT